MNKFALKNMKKPKLLFPQPNNILKNSFITKLFINMCLLCYLNS